MEELRKENRERITESLRKKAEDEVALNELRKKHGQELREYEAREKALTMSIANL